MQQLYPVDGPIEDFNYLLEAALGLVRRLKGSLDLLVQALVVELLEDEAALHLDPRLQVELDDG